MASKCTFLLFLSPVNIQWMLNGFCVVFKCLCTNLVSFHLWPNRDFAYVARDKDTRILKCHVFRCDTPAKAIATSLHEICSRVRITLTYKQHQHFFLPLFNWYFAGFYAGPETIHSNCTKWFQTGHQHGTLSVKNGRLNCRFNKDAVWKVFPVQMIYVLCNRSWQNARMPKLWLEDLYRTGHTLDLMSHYKVTPLRIVSVLLSGWVKCVLMCMLCVTLSRVPHAKDWAGAEIPGVICWYDASCQTYRWEIAFILCYVLMIHIYILTLIQHTSICLSTPGMEILNGAIDTLLTSSIRDDWIPVLLNVADATVTVIKEKAITPFTCLTTYTVIMKTSVLYWNLNSTDRS